jgi:large subunit ribosomal protein L25
MEQIELEASQREINGKKVRFLRREGNTPANMYGHGLDSVSLQVDTRKLKQTLARAGKTDLISLKVAGAAAPVMVLVRDVQKDYLNKDMLHVDFYQVNMSEKIKADVPLVFTGEAPALKKKNVSLLHLMDTLHVEALPDHLPHNVQVDMSKLIDTEHAIFVKDITLSEGVTLLSDPEQIVIKAVETRREEVEEAAVVKAEGEVAEGEVGAEGEAKETPEGKAKEAPEGKVKEAAPAAKDKSASKKA